VSQDSRLGLTKRTAHPTLCRENKVQVFLGDLISFDSQILDLPSGEERIIAHKD
jgi:hypothetical protein